MRGSENWEKAISTKMMVKIELIHIKLLIFCPFYLQDNDFKLFNILKTISYYMKVYSKAFTIVAIIKSVVLKNATQHVQTMTNLDSILKSRDMNRSDLQAKQEKFIQTEDWHVQNPTIRV